MHAHHLHAKSIFYGVRRDKNDTFPDPVAVLPFPSAKKAKAFVKVANMTQEERVEMLAVKIYESMRANDPDGKRYPWVICGNSLKQGQARDVASDILSALTFPQAGGGK